MTTLGELAEAPIPSDPVEAGLAFATCTLVAWRFVEGASHILREALRRQDKDEGRGRE